MVADDKRVAWILGAGFSRPLGGPLLDGLISRPMAGDFLNWTDFNQLRTPQGYDAVHCAEAVHGIYKRGCRVKHSTFWTNPEEFLERLDEAQDTTTLWDFRIRKLVPDAPPDPPPAKPSVSELRALLVHDMKALRREAIRFVSGACSYFTHGVGHKIQTREAWHPYLRWADKLQPQDVILTFNYDNVLDLLAPHMSNVRFQWMVPKNQRGDLSQDRDSRATRVFHMHGHVGWRRDANGAVLRGDPNAYVDPDSAVLGMPGPSKRQLSETHLEHVWHLGLHELMNADVVIFLGYRFPESDGMARHRILEALRGRGDARIYIVLGPRNPDVGRVKRMIEWTRPKLDDSVKIEELWAQDFLHSFERGKL
jgi:hypothetical protein